MSKQESYPIVSGQYVQALHMCLNSLLLFLANI